MRLLALLALLATPAVAQDAPGLSATEFDAYVAGKTLSWALPGQPWGTEEYLPNRQVQWATRPGECQIGTWYESSGQICFSYQDRADTSCWIFRKTDTGLTAELQGPTGPLTLTESGQIAGGMPCPGPEVGV